MRWLSSLSLSFKLPFVLTLVVVIVAATIGMAMIERDRQRLREALEGQALLLTRSIAATAPEPLLRGDSWTLYKTLRQITRKSDKSDLLTAMILDPNGRVIAHIYPALFPIGLPAADPNSPAGRRVHAELKMREPGVFDEPGLVEGYAPIQASDKNIGLVRLQLSTAELNRKTADATAAVLILTFGMTILGIMFGGIWSLRTLRPLRTLAQSMEALGQGVARPLSVSRGDEIGQLISSFNKMTTELEDKRRLEQELAANEKVVALGRIAAGMAHEVNNPLAGMLNCLSTLRAKSNDPELVSRYMPLLEKGLQRIEALVKDLLIELRVEDAHEVVDPSSLEDVRDLIAAEIDPSLIGFTWDNHLAPGDLVNKPKMQQILLNLMRNAIQAMPSGGRLCCRLWSEDDRLAVDVQDTGHGIKADDLKRIFDPFFTSRPNGTGLGLWIVLRLTQSMGGTVDVTSVPNQGTTFRVRIPREPKFVAQQVS